MANTSEAIFNRGFHFGSALFEGLEIGGSAKPGSAVKRVKFRGLAVHDYSFTLQQHRGGPYFL